MNTLKAYIFTICVALCSLSLSAQEGVIRIQQDAKIDQLLSLYSKVNSQKGYYQIQVGFGSYERAMELKSQVETDFPNWYSKIEFQEPTYRVRLGKFPDKLEAERRFLEVREKYPNAMLLDPENTSR